jgi:hypothetical protein
MEVAHDTSGTSCPASTPCGGVLGAATASATEEVVTTADNEGEAVVVVFGGEEVPRELHH